MADFRPTPHQRRCLIDATIAPLDLYRRGYARSRFGPFYPTATVLPLLREGALRKVKGRRGFIPTSVSAVADGSPALEAAE